MCNRDPNCLNSKILVLDTNFLDQVNRTIRREIADTELGQPVNELAPVFLRRIPRVLDSVLQCGTNEVFTSEIVYDMEIDINKLDSVLRTADMDFFDVLCRDEAFKHDLSEIYEEKIRIEDLQEGDLQDLRGILSDVGPADASLVLLALNLSQEREVIIITDDLDLREAIQDLQQNSVVTIGGHALSTRRAHFMGSLNFLEGLHSCCEVSNTRWRSAVWSFLEHQVSRYERGCLSEEKYDQHYECADQCLQQMKAACKAKRKSEEDRQFRQMFGVHDG